MKGNRRSGKLRVLLVEDNPRTVSFVWAALCQRWWGRAALESKKSLSEALDSLRSQIFDGLLVDLSVPDLESPDALSRLAEVAGNLPVILLISEADTDRMVRARSLGFHSWLRKETLTVSRLANEIGSALESAPATDTRVTS